MGDQLSFTRFLGCACHARGEGSAFFGTRRAAELQISRSAGCKNACKGVHSTGTDCTPLPNFIGCFLLLLKYWGVSMAVLSYAVTIRWRFVFDVLALEMVVE
jgi:hypothetical protein